MVCLEIDSDNWWSQLPGIWIKMITGEFGLIILLIQI